MYKNPADVRPITIANFWAQQNKDVSAKKNQTQRKQDTWIYNYAQGKILCVSEEEHDIFLTKKSVTGNLRFDATSGYVF